MARTPSRPRRPLAARLKMLASAGALLCAAALLAAPAAPAANAQLKEEFAEFLDCPQTTAFWCVVAHTTSGEFKMGNKDVPIEKPITLQGGMPLSGILTPMIPAHDGNTVISPPQKIPGGLLGLPGLLEGIGGEVTATATLASPTSEILVNEVKVEQGGEGTAVQLPLKIKLDNPLLGEECMIGSEAEPVVLHLETAKLGTETLVGKKKIIKLSDVVLEDNSFAVPAAKNCGLSTVLVNLLAGLPSAAGHNKAVMIGDFEQTQAKWAMKYAKQPKEKKKK
jgi:hypothetical protein